MMRHIHTRQLASSGLAARLVWFVAASSVMLSAFAAPPTVNLASEPLYSGGGNVRPNLLLDLSVEYPTVKAAYTNASDYDKTVEYLGYFNSRKCYTSGGSKVFSRDKNGASITSRTVSTSDMVNGYFSISKNADARYECGGDSFSGNFMNWASSSSIDMLRLSLTGGDRIVDTSSQTVLQRAFLHGSFYSAGGFFPKRIVRATATMSAPVAVTPYSVNTLYVVNCDNKILFTDVNVSGSCGTQRTYPSNNVNTDTFLDVNSDRVLGEFLVRVQVCDASENTSRTDLCLQYPNGTYKPVGQMQRNQNSVRYGAFGYLMDNVNTRYGGVLRAPLKYVGSKQYRAENGFAEEVNTRPEWDPQTGIYYDNPESDATGNSGVINYLNKFGRSGSYKSFDPLGELYYESIRYLQGKSPTPIATSGMTAAMKDNFQVLTNWTDPIEASCQKNYVIAIGDANTHQDTFIPGGTLGGAGRSLRPADAATPQWPAFDAKAQTALVAAMESSATSGNAAPVASLANMANAVTGSNGATFYMVGTAYWARNNDIRLDKPVRVKTFTIDVDENGNGSIDYTGRTRTAPRLSQLYLTAKYGGFSDLNLDKNPFRTFDTDGRSVISSNREWAEGNNTDPDNFFLASNPRRMMAAINSIFQTVASSGGTLAGVGISSTSSSDNPFVYEPGFKADKWSGSLKKLSATAANPSAVWDAGVILTGDPVTNQQPNPSPANRRIYTSKISADGSLELVNFSSGNNFSASDLAALNTDPFTGNTDNLASDRIQYLRGVRTLEQGRDANGNITGRFRKRDSVLGDIVNSAPVYYGAPARNVTGTGYSEFYTTNRSRQAAVYVGSNDGMLHAFDATNGQEIFSYIPNALLSKLNQLTNPNYSHSSFVDGRITVKEAQVNNVWKTLLVAGMGAGKKGVFALDVTNPANFSGGIGALWEFTDAIDRDMGYVLSPPLIAKFRTGGTAASPTFGNFVVISSGYNNYDNDVNATGQGALFILSLDKRPSDPWVRGSNYFKFMTPITNRAAKNGLGAPNVAYGPNGAVSYAYAGDLQGNLWRFDFSAGGLGRAGVASRPVFTAKDSSGVPQPITVQPQIVFAPGGGYILTFGTGKYMETYDVTPSNYMTNSYYAILDTTYDSDVVTSRTELQQRTLTTDGSGFRIGGNKFVYGVVAGTKKGWYLDFSNSQTTGERIHHTLTGTLAGNYLFFNTLILSSDPCSGGSGRKYAVDVLTGMNSEVTGTLSTIGLLTSPIVINISTSAGDRTGTGSRRITTRISVRTAGTGNSSGVTTENSAAADAVTRAGRISWQEIRNWQELKRAATAGGA